MEITIGVYGMTCGHCQKSVADAISSLEGVESVDVNLEAESATVIFDPEKVSLDEIKGAILKAGYSTEKEGEAEAEAQEETSESAGKTAEAPEIAGKEAESEVSGTVESEEAAGVSCTLDEACKLAEKKSLGCQGKKQAQRNHPRSFRDDLLGVRPEYREGLEEKGGRGFRSR